MEFIIEQLSNLILSPTGVLLYHLVIIFSITASLQLVVGSNAKNDTKSSKRLITGLTFLLVGRLIVFLFAALSSQNIINARLIMPLLDRSTITFSILWLVWLWAFPHPSKTIDIILGLLNGLIIILFAFSLWVWSENFTKLTLNATEIDWMWSILSIVFLFIGIYMLLAKKPETWGIGLASFLINLLGQVAHLFLLSGNGDYSLYLRIAMLCSFPLLPSLIRRNVSFSPFGKETSLPQTSLGFFNKNIKILAQSDPKAFEKRIPDLVLNLSSGDLCYLIESTSNHQIHINRLNNLNGKGQKPANVIFEQEEVPILAHAVEGQFVMTYKTVPEFKDEFRTIGNSINTYNSQNVMVMPFPIRPEAKSCLMIIRSNKAEWDEIDQAEISSSVLSLLLIFHQKQREQQLQKSVQRLLESNKSVIRTVTSKNFQSLQQDFNELTQRHQTLLSKFKQLQKDMVYLSDRVEIHSQGMTTLERNKSIEILKSWLDQAQTENGLLQTEIEQLLRENQSISLEIEHYREIKNLEQYYDYLKPSEPQPLDAQTNLNETLNRAFEILFKVSEMNDNLEQNQVQSVVLLESIQEQLKNIHQLQTDDPEDFEDETSFITQAEYFLEDIRTAQSLLKEQTRLQKLLEETFFSNLKMKDNFDHLTQLNHRNYEKINQIYMQIDSYRSQNEETSLILTNIQDENEKLRTKMLQAIAKNKGDSTTIDNLQSEMLSALEEINILKDKVEQKQDILHQNQIQSEMLEEGLRENNQLINSLIQDILQPLSSISGSLNLLSAHFSSNDDSDKVLGQIHLSLSTIKGQVDKLITCTQRSEQLLKMPPALIKQINTNPEKLSSGGSTDSHE